MNRAHWISWTSRARPRLRSEPFDYYDGGWPLSLTGRVQLNIVAALEREVAEGRGPLVTLLVPI